MVFSIQSPFPDLFLTESKPEGKAKVVCDTTAHWKLCHSIASESEIHPGLSMQHCKNVQMGLSLEIAQEIGQLTAGRSTWFC